MSPGDGNRLPLTAAQRGIWYAQGLDATNPIYNGAEYVDIAGPVDAGVFLATLIRVVGETDALRVRFHTDDEGPWQVVHDEPAVDLAVTDVSTEPDPVAAAERLMLADVRRPVDLLRGPLFTHILFRVSDDRHLWYHRCHHILLDGFSGALFAARVAAVYTALAAGAEVPPSGFRPLRDLVDAEAAYRASDRFTADRDYWTAELAHRPEPPTLAARHPTMPDRLVRHRAELPVPTARAVREAARSCGVTLPAMLTALVATYLQRLTGAPEVVLGLPVTTRLGREARSVPGMVSNVLPLRVAVRPEWTLEELGAYVSTRMREALRHQRYRFEDLRRDLNLVGDERRLVGPDVNIMMFDYDVRFAGARATAHSLALGPVDDLSVVVYDRSDAHGLRIDFEGNPHLYSDEELAAHHERFLAFVAAAVDHSGPVGRLDTVAPAAVDWSFVSDPPSTPVTTLADLFARQAARTPDATAVVDGDRRLSYRDIAGRANRLARELVRSGAGPERFVALALPRTADLVVAVLAVVASGAAYVPLDPQYPTDRLAFMLDDTRPVVLVSTAEVLSRLPDVPVTCLSVEDGPGGADGTPLTDADRVEPLRPEHPAYVIYTSGSTGRPKGVVIPHHNVVRLFDATDAWFGFGTDDVWTLFHSYAFDFSVWELWGALLFGGTLVVVPHA
ncbi:hypothetical protein GCM10009557_62170 [Virgisporangium ochraceum]